MSCPKKESASKLQTATNHRLEAHGGKIADFYPEGCSEGDARLGGYVLPKCLSDLSNPDPVPIPEILSDSQGCLRSQRKRQLHHPLSTLHLPSRHILRGTLIAVFSGYVSRSMHTSRAIIVKAPGTYRNPGPIRRTVLILRATPHLSTSRITLLLPAFPSSTAYSPSYRLGGEPGDLCSASFLARGKARSAPRS